MIAYAKRLLDYCDQCVGGFNLAGMVGFRTYGTLYQKQLPYHLATSAVEDVYALNYCSRQNYENLIALRIRAQQPEIMGATVIVSKGSYEGSGHGVILGPEADVLSIQRACDARIVNFPVSA